MRYTHTHTHNEYYSAMKMNEIGSFVEIEMDLEHAIQSEISRKGKYHTLMHIYEI